MPSNSPLTANHGDVPCHRSSAYPSPPRTTIAPVKVYAEPAAGPARSTFSWNPLVEFANGNWRSFLAMTYPSAKVRPVENLQHTLRCDPTHQYRPPVYPL